MKLTLRGSYHTFVISHTELASHKNQRLLLFYMRVYRSSFFMFQGKLWKLTQLKTPQLTCISLTTRHIPKISTLIAKEQVGEKKNFQVSWIFWIFPPWIEWWKIWRCPLFAEVSALLTGKSVHDSVYIECIGASSVHQPHASPLSTLNPASSQSEFHN